jgi:DNA helicase HerA-like ATPase
MFHQRHADQLILGTFGPPPLRIPVRIPVAALTNHLHISGATNSGKSRLLAHIALSLIERGEGVTLLDPHGDTVRLVLGHLVARGLYADPATYERISYLDLPAAARVWRYAPLNILDQPFDAPTTARLVLEAFRRAWPALDEGIAPAFENAVLAGVSVLIRHKLDCVT